jgi:signal transduction histidine kinase
MARSALQGAEEDFAIGERGRAGEGAPPDILVVDDDPGNLAAIEVALGELGRSLVKARSGEEALRHLLEQDFALILLDVNMPGMDGFETARVIRERPRSRHVPIIFVTAYNREDTDLILRGYSLGAVDFLFKPIVPEVLRAKAAVFVELQNRTAVVQRQAEMLREMERRELERRMEEERQAWEAQALREENQRKDEFLAVLAHELRNPLAPIRTGLELIRLTGDSPESVRRVRPIMERQIGQMVRLIDDLLDISRITSGKISLQRAPASLRELIQAAVDAQRQAIDTSQIELTVDMPPADCVVDVDATRFVQILSNVLHNAAKFTPAHGKIRCSTAIVPAADRPRVALTISDTGVGISTDLLPRVFEMFTQAESATERQHGGLGIGLALARRLVDMHGGNIAAESDGPGKGSTFTITMPLCEARAPAPARLSDVPRINCRVLIIDDNRDAAHTLAMLVQELGGETEIAHDSASGLQAVEDAVPDVVFLDIGLPGIDGYEACRQIRRRPAKKPVAIIAVTGWGQPQDKQRALDAGFDAHLTKPVELEALARILPHPMRG